MKTVMELGCTAMLVRPSFNPMDYDASRLDLEMAPPEAPPVKGTDPPKQPKPPATPSVS